MMSALAVLVRVAGPGPAARVAAGQVVVVVGPVGAAGGGSPVGVVQLGAEVHDQQRDRRQRLERLLLGRGGPSARRTPARPGHDGERRRGHL